MPLRQVIFAAALIPVRDRDSTFFRDLGPRPHFWLACRTAVLVQALRHSLARRAFRAWSCASRGPARDARRIALLLAIVPVFAGGRQSRRTARRSGHALGPKADRHQCRRLSDQHSISWPRAARCRSVCPAPRRTGTAGSCGAAAGLLAGAIGAALYATHCPDDSPLFVATWYTLAIGFVVGLGALAGSRLLRW